MADLARQAVDILGRLLTGALESQVERAGNDLYNIVTGKLRRAGKSQVFDRFESGPTADEGRRDLARTIDDEMRTDTSFRGSLIAGVNAVVNLSLRQSSTSAKITADRGAFASGRDMMVDQSQDRRRTNYGGLVVGIVAVVVVLAVLLIGRVVVNVVDQIGDTTQMTASTTCSEFLAADAATQASVMKRLYLDANKPDRAADPFIVQNAQYSCGSAPNMTLGKLVSLSG